MTTTHITNGHLYLGRGRWEPGGVLVRDGLIAATGADADLAPLRDAATEIVDAGGASVLPGFHDTHVHPVVPGVFDLLEELCARVEPPGILLERDDDFPPEAALRAELDAIAAATERGAARRRGRA